MKTGRPILCCCPLAAAAFLACSACNQEAPGMRTSGSAGRVIRYYRDPMHPSYTSDKPGKAPDGMALEPVYAEAEIAPEPGIIRIAPEKQKTMGITLGQVGKGPVTTTLRTLGRVAVDESRVFPVNAGADGVVKTVFPASTDTTVQKGQPLVSVYGREYVTAQRTFLYALRATLAVPPTSGLDYQDQPAFGMEEARLNLVDMGFGEVQLAQILRERRPLLDVVLVAPAAGTVMSRNAFAGQRFSRGAELLRIADLSRVWIVADAIGEEAQYVRRSPSARISIPYRPDLTFPASISAAQPRFDPATRTLKVRLEMDNPSGSFRPGMFVDVAFSFRFPDSITVPAPAVVDSGLRKTVFVNHDNGEFEARPVELGWRAGDRVQVLRGLVPGESIVTSGNFLLDSASRLQTPAPHAHRHD